MAAGEKAVIPDGDMAGTETRMLVHDLRNLLAVILNYSELIGDESSDPEAVKADVLEIRQAAERAIALTERLPRDPISGPRSKPTAGSS